jgi:dipeptidyl-peptidase-4
LEELLRRERTRQRGLGITQYFWSPCGDRVMLPIHGDLYIQEGQDGSLQKILTAGDKPILTPRFSPDGQWIAYVQDAEVYTIPVEGGEPVQITFGARGTGKTNGLAEYVAQEEMDRRLGFWWSGDSQQIAFVEVDESHIPVYRIAHQGKSKTGEGAQEDHHYPFAGADNARVRLGVIPRIGGDPIWMPLEDGEEYLGRVNWMPGGTLVAQLINRPQTALKLVRFDPKTGIRTTLIHETTPVWINLHKMFKPLKADHKQYPGGFIWASELTGYRHLYLHDHNGELIRQLTDGDWVVDELVAVDQVHSQVFFTGTRHGPTEKHLYAVSLDGGKPRRVTDEPGIHSIVIDRTCERFVDIHHRLDSPPSVTLRTLADGSQLQTVFHQPAFLKNKPHLTPPQIITLTNRVGVQLYGALYKPPSHFGPGPYPTIVYVYGGPHAQQVTNSWSMTVNMRAQFLRSLGFLVFVLDNRGSSRRGLAFEGAIQGNMGHLEVEDQVDGVNWLIHQGLADPDRVGIYGWSYGGYMAAMSLARAPKTFQVAVAGAPVTHWDGYDTFYTERYMGTPQSNPDGYAVSSVMHHADKIKGKLMLVHGLIDENVHFRHTARLINALIRARVSYELLLFPDERHMPRKFEDRVYMEEQIRDYFLAHL